MKKSIAFFTENAAGEVTHIEGSNGAPEAIVKERINPVTGGACGPANSGSFAEPGRHPNTP